jgi:hypothetical protein
MAADHVIDVGRDHEAEPARAEAGGNRKETLQLEVIELMNAGLWLCQTPRRICAHDGIFFVGGSRAASIVEIMTERAADSNVVGRESAAQVTNRA